MQGTSRTCVHDNKEKTLLEQGVHTSWASIKDTLKTNQVCTVVLPAGHHAGRLLASLIHGIGRGKDGSILRCRREAAAIGCSRS